MEISEATLKQIAEESVLEVVLYAYHWKRADDPAIPDKEIWNYAIVESEAKTLVENVLRKHLLRVETVELERTATPIETVTGQEAIKILRRSDLVATWEYPGYISITTPGGMTLCVGTADGYWGYNVMDKEGFDRTPPITPEMAAIKDVIPQIVRPELIAKAIQSILAVLR